MNIIKQRDAILIVEAAKGDKRAANTLIRRSIKAAGLKVLTFVSEAEAKNYGLGESRFTVACTDEEFANLLKIGSAFAKAEGWNNFPVDSYHD